MEWVTTTGKTVEEAQERALDQLGVLAEDAEFEVLDEPRSGLFGRVRGEAKVRARVRPTQVRAKVERKERRRPASEPASTGQPREPKPNPRPKKGKPVSQPESNEPTGAERAPAAPRAGRSESSRHESGRRESNREAGDGVDAAAVGAEAEKFLVGLLDAFDLNGEVAVNQDGDDLDVQITGEDLGVLIGPKGATLLAVQDVVRVASQRRLGDHSTHLRVDVSGYRARRREALARFATEQAALVRESGKARLLEPMPSADRKIVHDTVAELPGVASRSEGEDPRRRVVIIPSGE